MSTLQVSNIHFESTANNRIQYNGSNNWNFVAGGNTLMTVNTSIVSYSTAASFANSCTFGGSVSDVNGNIRDLPIASQSGTYTLVANDSGKMIATTANVAIPASVFTNGQNISIYNNSASSISITSAAGVTAYLVGTSSTGTRSLTQRGLATIVCVGANTFVVTGGGLT
jgi:hypothetical protein